MSQQELENQIIVLGNGGLHGGGSNGGGLLLLLGLLLLVLALLALALLVLLALLVNLGFGLRLGLGNGSIRSAVSLDSHDRASDPAVLVDLLDLNLLVLLDLSRGSLVILRLLRVLACLPGLVALLNGLGTSFVRLSTSIFALLDEVLVEADGLLLGGLVVGGKVADNEVPHVVILDEGLGLSTHLLSALLGKELRKIGVGDSANLEEVLEGLEGTIERLMLEDGLDGILSLDVLLSLALLLELLDTILQGDNATTNKRQELLRNTFDQKM